FGEYAAILRTVLERWISVRGQLREEKLNEEAEELILPSNEDWRQRVYYRLVELQRECDAQFGTKSLDYEEPKETDRDGKSKAAEKSWEWEPRIHGSSLLDIKRGSRRNGNESRMSRTSVVGSMTEARVEPGWRVNDILLAAEVLRRDSSPTYSDEAEMRRVFGLVYDVLRYKRIFGRALDEVGFWLRNSKLVDRRKIVWLLLYDMQGRKFASRGEIADVMEREILFQAAGLMDIEKALLEAKTHLAASISRLRIRGSALSLDELLPSRLRVIEGVAWGEEAETGAVASGWVNGNKFANKQEFHEEMSKLKLVFCEDEDGATDLVDETGYAFDSICPKIVNLHEEARETLALSALVRDHRFVFLVCSASSHGRIGEGHCSSGDPAVQLHRRTRHRRPGRGTWRRHGSPRMADRRLRRRWRSRGSGDRAYANIIGRSDVPIGAGLAFAHKYNGTGGVAWALYGDGAASQGQIYETYNMSKLWNLPVVFICENNLFGMGTAVHRHSANTAFYTRGDLIPGIKVDGMSVPDVREAVRFARDHALRNGPIILEMVTYRYFGHSMSDPGTSYRTRDETKQVQTEQDPITTLAKLVVKNGLKTEKEVEASQEIRTATWKEVDKELEEAKADPFPEMSEIGTNVHTDSAVKARGKVPWQ
ncbi:Pyruvate dehydrogenase E1 component subunit alpha-2, mitochondrial, partial [Dufourea novaeangliae]